MPYRHPDYPGAAWTIDGPTMVDEYDPDTGENVTDWTGYKVPAVPATVDAHMIGDDRTFRFDADELIELDDDDYCAECGQIGCTADGRDREADDARP